VPQIVRRFNVYGLILYVDAPATALFGSGLSCFGPCPAIHHDGSYKLDDDLAVLVYPVVLTPTMPTLARFDESRKDSIVDSL